MESELLKKLYAEQLIGDESFQKMEQEHLHPLLSVFWELRTMLYLGIILLTTGLGIFVYQNIDTIGHGVILALIASISGGCLFYCWRNKEPFKTEKVMAPNAYFDYVLLLGTATMLMFTGYLQYQYNVFGTSYGMATFIPMVVLFFIAYFFDHLGVLNMAIVNLALWLGVSVTPKDLLAEHTFDSQPVTYTYVGLGLLLLLAAWLAERKNLKKHFSFSYRHYGIHLCFISLLAGYFTNYDQPADLLWILTLFVLATLIFMNAYRQKSFYFLLLTIFYSYIAFSCLVVRWLITLPGDGGIWLLFFYFIGSAAGLVYLLISLNKQIKAV